MATTATRRSTASAVGTPRADLALLIGRLGLGLVYIAHGWQKLVTDGMSATTDGFAAMGIPLPGVSAWFASVVELGGGAALVLGLAVPLVGLLLAVDMLGALVLVHAGNGIFVGDGGYELVLVLLVGSLVLAGLGSGRYGLDPLIFGRRRR